MREKRSYERFELDGRVAFKNNDRLSALDNVYLDNIGFGGFAMYSQNKIGVGIPVDFELIVSSLGESLSGKGRIRYVNLPEYNNAVFNMGVEFTEVNGDQVTHLIKKIQFKIVAELRKRNKTKPLDFMPY